MIDHLEFNRMLANALVVRIRELSAELHHWVRELEKLECLEANSTASEEAAFPADSRKQDGQIGDSAENDAVSIFIELDRDRF